MKHRNRNTTILSVIVVIAFYAALTALLMYLEDKDPNRKIDSYEDALWYLVATLTTVGYGDMYPVTSFGRLIGFVFLFSSLGVYGFIIGQIANFMSTLSEQKELGLNGSSFKNHVVIIGWNDFSQSVMSHVIGAGRQVAIVTKERSHIDIIREYYTHDQVFTLYTDYNNFEFIEKTNIRQSSVVFINLHDDTEKLVYIINIKKHFDNLNYVVTLDNGNLKHTFQNAGVTYAISKNDISSKLLASYIYEPDVAMFSEELIAYAHEDHEYDMKQFMVKTENPFAGMPYDKAFLDLKMDCNVILIGLVKTMDGKRNLLKNPEGNIKIAEGDYLVVMMDRKGQDKMKQIFHIKEGISH
jgi:voltage-gated potassium channel